MKNVIIVLAAMFLCSCKLVMPRPGCGDWRDVQRHDRKPMKAQVPRRQWMKQLSDGYWLVTTTHGNQKPDVRRYECKPDSIELSKL